MDERADLQTTASGSAVGTGRQAGQTLLEIVFAAFIAGTLALMLMTGMSLTLLRGRTKLSTIRRNRDVLVADLRAQQQLSLVGKTVSVCTTGSLKKLCPADGSCVCANEVPKGGYGAFLVPCQPTGACSYYLFADLDGDQNYDYLGNYGAGGELLPSGMKGFESGIYVAQLQPTYQGCSASSDTTSFTATFQPYTGSATLKGNSTCSDYQSAARLSETVQFGPLTGGGAKAVINRGSGGIQER